MAQEFWTLKEKNYLNSELHQSDLYIWGREKALSSRRINKINK